MTEPVNEAAAENPDLETEPASGKKKKIITILSGIVFSFAVAGLLIYLLWGFINPGWGFKVFLDDRLPENFDNALRILKDTVFSENVTEAGKQTKMSATLSRWTAQIRIKIDGDPDEKDIETVSLMCEAYNTIPGFPGISVTEGHDEKANASIIFATKETHAAYQAELDMPDSSMCRLQYNRSTIISAEILIEPGHMRGYRNSIILHESFHMLGFMGHTSYSKSIVNDKLPVTGLSAADKLAIRVLYYPEITLGTSYETLEELSKLYSVNQFVGLSDALLD